MKSVNEQIMEIMDLHEKKWKRKDGLLAVVGLESKDGSRFYSETNFKTSLPLSKLLQQRLVDDGWSILMMVYRGGFMMSAWKNSEIGYQTEPGISTEPAALFDLFCKCYGISK